MNLSSTLQSSESKAIRQYRKQDYNSAIRFGRMYNNIAPQGVLIIDESATTKLKLSALCVDKSPATKLKLSALFIEIA